MAQQHTDQINCFGWEIPSKLKVATSSNTSNFSFNSWNLAQEGKDNTSPVKSTHQWQLESFPRGSDVSVADKSVKFVCTIHAILATLQCNHVLTQILWCESLPLQNPVSVANNTSKFISTHFASVANSQCNLPCSKLACVKDGVHLPWLDPISVASDTPPTIIWTPFPGVTSIQCNDISIG